MPEPRVRASHQVQPLRIRRPVLEKLVQRCSCILKLTCRNVRRRHFAPNLVLRVRRISSHNLFEILNRVAVSLLLSRDASQLIARVNLFRIDL